MLKADWFACFSGALVVLYLSYQGYAAEVSLAPWNATAADIALRNLARKFDASSSEGRVAKSVFSHTKRLLFVAGLEGSGHHGWNEIFHVCISTEKCFEDRRISRALFRRQNGTSYGVFTAESVGESGRDLVATYDGLKAFKQVAIDGLYILRGAGELSYPNFGGKHKSMNHPDVSMLAVLADSIGIDFRIIVLQRSAAGILASTSRRDFGEQQEPRILLDNSAALYSQLRALDPKFFNCVEFEQMRNLTSSQQEALASFLHPSIKPILPKMLSNFQLPTISNNTNSHGELGGLAAASNRYYETLLKANLNLIRILCDK